MSSLNGRTCRAAYMHENAHLPGVGDIGKELIVGRISDKRVDSIVVNESFVEVTIYGAISKRQYVMLVPVSNFKYLVLNETIVTTPPLK